jgi:hypothetical protein
VPSGYSEELSELSPPPPSPQITSRGRAVARSRGRGLAVTRSRTLWCRTQWRRRGSTAASSMPVRAWHALFPPNPAGAPYHHTQHPPGPPHNSHHSAATPQLTCPITTSRAYRDPWIITFTGTTQHRFFSIFHISPSGRTDGAHSSKDSESIPLFSINFSSRCAHERRRDAHRVRAGVRDDHSAERGRYHWPDSRPGHRRLVRPGACHCEQFSPSSSLLSRKFEC